MPSLPVCRAILNRKPMKITRKFPGMFMKAQPALLVILTEAEPEDLTTITQLSR
jgi:hypothetical protein